MSTPTTGKHITTSSRAITVPKYFILKKNSKFTLPSTMFRCAFHAHTVTSYACPRRNSKCISHTLMKASLNASSAKQRSTSSLSFIPTWYTFTIKNVNSNASSVQPSFSEKRICVVTQKSFTVQTQIHCDRYRCVCVVRMLKRNFERNLLLKLNQKTHC